MKLSMLDKVVKCQNSSKSNLFQKLKNTAILKWHYDSILSPQMLILLISSPNKYQLFAKIQIFLKIFSVNRIKYPDEKKCIYGHAVEQKL